MRNLTHIKSFGRILVYAVGVLLAHPSLHASTSSTQIKEGLSYQKITSPLSQTIHVLEIDPKQFQILPKHAKGSAKGLETLDALVKQNNALAGINGGFFHLKEHMEGLPAGILKIEQAWYGIAYTFRAALGWSKDNAMVLMDRIQTRTSLKINHTKYPVHAVNLPSGQNKAVLFTPVFGQYAHSTPEHTDLVIQDHQLKTIQAGGKTEIPENGYVYSIGPDVDALELPAEGSAVDVQIVVIPQINKKDQKAWQAVDNIVGGTPLLMKNNSVVVSAKQKQMQTVFAGTQYARTAVGTLKNGHWVFVVVENQGPDNPGMTLLELADFMKGLNCEQAINLDGGSSSGLFLNPNIIPNAENMETSLTSLLFRRIADGILVLEKK